MGQTDSANPPPPPPADEDNGQKPDDPKNAEKPKEEKPNERKRGKRPIRKGKRPNPPSPEEEPPTELQDFSPLEIDPETEKYFNPNTGEYVATPGKHEPPKRPLRVKVRVKRKELGERGLRKRRDRPLKGFPLPVQERIRGGFRNVQMPPSPKPTPRLPRRPETVYDERGNPEIGEFDEYGNHLDLIYDEEGIPWGYDFYGYPLDFDEYGDPLSPGYRYDEYGVLLPFYPDFQPKWGGVKEHDEPVDENQKQKNVGVGIPTYTHRGGYGLGERVRYIHPDDGYDYDDDTYTWTTLDSPRTPSESSDEVQEPDDSGDERSMEDVDDFFWRPYQPVMPKDEARASLRSGGEFCRCFPQRSNPNIPSMVYDRIECPHTNNVIGQAHGSVYRFDENWDEKYTKTKRPIRPERVRSKVAFVWGYPEKQYPAVDEGQKPFEGGLRGEFQRPSTPMEYETEDEGRRGEYYGSDRKDGTADNRFKKGSHQGQTDKRPSVDAAGPPTAAVIGGVAAVGKESKPADGKGAKAGSKKEAKPNDKIVNGESKDAADKPGSKDKINGANNKGSQRNIPKDTKPDQKDAHSESPATQKPASYGKPDSREASAPQSGTEQYQGRPQAPANQSRQGQGQINREKVANKLPAAKRNQPERDAQGSRASLVAETFLPKIGFTPENPFGKDGVNPPRTPPNRREPEPVQFPTIQTPSVRGYSPALSFYSSTPRSTDFYPRAEVNTKRVFQGKYYDPKTGKMYTYDIRPKFGLGMDQWEARRN